MCVSSALRDPAWWYCAFEASSSKTMFCIDSCFPCDSRISGRPSSGSSLGWVLYRLVLALLRLSTKSALPTKKDVCRGGVWGGR